MAQAPDVGMDKADLKRLLNAAKSDPISCALGLSGDSAVGLVMLHKTKSPKAVEKELSGKFPDAKLTRWGTAGVDEESGILNFTINKAASGLARRLVKSLKGTGFSKINIRLEDGSSVDGASDDEEAEAEPGGTGDAAAAEPDAAPAAQQAAPGGPDIATLTQDLRGLIGQIGAAGGGDAGRITALKAAAGEAGAAIKAADGTKAAEAIQALKDLLAAAPAPAASGAPAVGTVNIVAMQKSRLLWDSARKRVASEIDSLKKGARELFEGDPEEAQALDALDQLDEITSALDDRLLDALDDLLSEQDPVKHAELLSEAKEVLAEYADFVSSNELIQKLNGDTPFGTKLTIGATYGSVIKALQANLR